MVLGISFPVDFANTLHKKRQLNAIYNFHLQYVPPTKPLYWWDFFDSPTFEARHVSRTSRAVLPHDHSREFVYNAIEMIFHR